MKRELAIALGYRVDEESAPRVLATGEGWLARKIQEIARVHGIPREADADLATILAQCLISPVQYSLARASPARQYGRSSTGQGEGAP